MSRLAGIALIGLGVACWPRVGMANLFTTYAQSPAETTDKDALITWTATGKQSANVDVLFVQNAKGANI